MTRLDRYIAASLLKSWVLVLAILLALFTLLALVNEMERVSARYLVTDVLRYVLLTTPQRVVDLAPVWALLGTLFSLATLSKNNELTALRAAGISLRRLVQAILIPTAGLVAILLLASEFVVPPMSQHAETERIVIRSPTANILEGQGLWSRDGTRFFNVSSLRLGQIPTGIDVYEFSADGKLLSAIHADHAVLDETRRWQLVDVQRKQLIDGILRTSYEPQMDLGPLWSREELPVLSLSISHMSLSGLYEYAQHLHETGQDAERTELAFWKKLALPLAAGAMVLLATPIGAAVSSQRSAGFGQRIAAGAFVGILFYLGTQIIYTSGLILNLNIALVGIAPVLLVLATAALLFYRMS